MKIYTKLGKYFYPIQMQETILPAHVNVLTWDTQDTQGDTQDTRAKIPLQPMEKTMVKQVGPCSPWGGRCQRRYPLYSPQRTLHCSRQIYPEESCCPQSMHLTGTVAHWSPMLVHSEVPERLYPWRGPVMEQFLKNCGLWEGPHWSSSGRILVYMRDPTLEKWRSVRSLRSTVTLLFVKQCGHTGAG